MSGAEHDLTTEVLLSLQRALLGMVTADLRAVIVDIEARDVRGQVIYEGEVTEDHRELVDEVETLVLADMDDDVRVRLEPVTVPYPRSLPLEQNQLYSYLRRES